MPNLKSEIRSIDEQGRITIPLHIREEFEWKAGKDLRVAIIDTTAKVIVIREIWPCCSLCRKAFENLQVIEQGHVCPQCAAKITSII